MRRAGTLLTILALLAASCLPASIPATRPASTKPTPNTSTTSLVRIAWADVGVPTPFRVSMAGPGGVVLLSLLYDTLTWKDEQGIIPWLASRWDISADGLDYTFTLATDVTWSDGQPLTAEDVAFSFTYYLRHPFAWSRSDMVESASVLAPDRVRIRLKHPYAPFLEEVAGSVPIIPAHVWSRVDDPATYDAPDATVGSGPYRLAEYRSAEGAYRLLANDDYFRGPVAVREIQQLNVPEETRLDLLQRGELDLVMSTDASVMQLFANHPRIRVLETLPLSIVRLAVNTARPPLDDRDVRQALALALDRQQIAETLTRTTPVIGSGGIIPPETPWFNPRASAYSYAPEQARALLAGRRLTLELLAEPANREPELMQPMLEAVGISLDVRRVDGRTRTQLLREGSFMLGQVQHIGVGGDPDYLRRWYAGEEANAYAQGSVFHHPEFERLAREQATTREPARRLEIVHRLQEIHAEELPTIPLYYRRFYWVYDATRYTPVNTWGGLMNGIPLVHNKLTFLARSP